MGKGGICIHYTLPVVSEGVTAGRDLDRLVYHFFNSLFGLVFPCLGGLLGERIRMSVSTPFSPSWDTILSLNPTSAYRGTDKGPRNQWLYVLVPVSVCVCVSGGCRMCVCMCVCVTEAVTSMSLCCPVRNLSPPGGRLEWDARSKTQTDSCPLWILFSFPALIWSVWVSEVSED